MLALGCALAAAPVAAPLAASADNVTVIVNGQTMSFDQPPIIQAGRVFVPLRAIFEQLGASVVYSNGQINATARGRTVSLTIGSTQATVNGRSTTLDVAPFIVGSRTLVPLRFVSESLGATVNWNDSNSTVTITGGGGGGRNPNPPPPPARNVLLTYNWPTGTIYNHYPQIRFNLNRNLQPGSFQMMLDGRDITRSVTWNGQWWVAPAPWSLGMGNHRVRVYGRTAAGIPFDLNWTFNQASY